MSESTADNILHAVDAARQRGLEGLGRKALALERLLEISRRISTLDLSSALSAIMADVLELTATRRGVLLLDEDGALRPVLSVNLERDALEGEGFAVSRSVVERALGTGEVVVIRDAPTSDVGDRTSIVALGLEAVLAIPLCNRETVLGVIYLDTDRERHQAGSLDSGVLAAFGAQAAVALGNARRHESLREDYFQLRRSVGGLRCGEHILYRSRAMDRVCEAVGQVATSDVTVLVLGETGTGKELVARAIHDQSRRRQARFLAQNAGALPDELLESELFGHRRGAFSGALEHRAGLFEAGDGGTVFLDEIGEASPALQVRLLRFLETGTFRRVGETTDRLAEVRIVAATHRDLEADVRAGRFREDLYYRLNVFPITVPPLRQRRDDIDVLVPHFVELYNRELGRSVSTIPQAVVEALRARDWPGNVRELANTVQRLVLLSSGSELLAPEDPEGSASRPVVPSSETAAGTTASLPTLEEVERRHIRQALVHTGGNQSQAARLLGLDRSNLRRRIHKLGIRR